MEAQKSARLRVINIILNVIIVLSLLSILTGTSEQFDWLARLLTTLYQYYLIFGVIASLLAVIVFLTMNYAMPIKYLKGNSNKFSYIEPKRIYKFVSSSLSIAIIVLAYKCGLFKLAILEAILEVASCVMMFQARILTAKIESFRDSG